MDPIDRLRDVANRTPAPDVDLDPAREALRDRIARSGPTRAKRPHAGSAPLALGSRIGIAVASAMVVAVVVVVVATAMPRDTEPDVAELLNATATATESPGPLVITGESTEPGPGQYLRTEIVSERLYYWDGAPSDGTATFDLAANRASSPGAVSVTSTQVRYDAPGEAVVDLESLVPGTGYGDADGATAAWWAGSQPGSASSPVAGRFDWPRADALLTVGDTVPHRYEEIPRDPQQLRDWWQGVLDEAEATGLPPASSTPGADQPYEVCTAYDGCVTYPGVADPARLPLQEVGVDGFIMQSLVPDPRSGPLPADLEAAMLRALALSPDVRVTHADGDLVTLGVGDRLDGRPAGDGLLTIDTARGLVVGFEQTRGGTTGGIVPADVPDLRVTVHREIVDSVPAA